jgi:hypothetical protein
MRAFAPTRIGPSMSSTDVNDVAHVGHRSTSVKTDHTTPIGAAIVIDARSTASFAMLPSFDVMTLVATLSTLCAAIDHRAERRQR